MQPTAIERRNDDIVVVPTNAMQSIVKIILDSGLSISTKRVYKMALTGFLEWYVESQQTILNRHAVQSHLTYLTSQGVPTSSLNLRLAAIKAFAYEANQNGLIADDIFSGIKNIKTIKQDKSQKLGNWLDKSQSSDLIAMPDTATLKGKRDRAILTLMLYSGLRRDELCNLTVGNIQQREGRWVIVDLVGKGNKTRSIPIKSVAKAVLDVWLDAYPHTNESPLFVSLTRGHNFTNRPLTGDAVLKIIQSYYPDIASHDLRRTFAQLARKAGVSIEQIQVNLGHSSVQTTERYLSTQLDLQNSASDAIDIEVNL